MQASEQNTACHQFKILLADDCPSIRQLLEYNFTLRGHEVSLACNGLETLDKWRTGRYDLILMDLLMPVMDGYETASRIRAEEESEGRRRTPIIAVTANEDISLYERCLESGMDDYIAKPLTPAGMDSLLALLGSATAAQTDDNITPHCHNGLFDPDFLGSMVDRKDRMVLYAKLLTADLERGMVRLADSVEAGDMGALSDTAHAIKGAAQPLRGSKMSALAGEIQNAARTGDIDSVRMLFSRLQEIHQKVRMKLLEVGRAN